MQVKTLDSLAASGVLKDKRVLIRSDLNVPRNDEGAITNDARIVASLPAIKTALLAGAAVMVTSHLGRPKEGVLRPEDSLQVVADRLGELLGREVPVVQDWVDGVEVKPGELVVLENCRCNVGEKKCDEALSKKYAALWMNAARCSRFLKRRVQSCRCPSMSWRPRLLRLMHRTAFAVLMKWPMTR